MISVEFALLEFGVKAEVSKALEYFAYVVFVLLGGCGVDEDVVQINDDVDVQDVPEEVVHEVLEGSGRFGESERHHAVFVEAVSCPEGRLPFFPRERVATGMIVGLGASSGRCIYCRDRDDRENSEDESPRGETLDIRTRASESRFGQETRNTSTRGKPDPCVLGLYNSTTPGKNPL